MATISFQEASIETNASLRLQIKVQQQWNYSQLAEGVSSVGPSVDLGLQALIDGNYPTKPVAPILPEKLYVIYGLESSGTTFTAKTIALALRCIHLRGDFMSTVDHRIQVQHISLPWGFLQEGNPGFAERYTKPLPTVPVFYPTGCRLDNQKGKWAPYMFTTKPECVSIMGKEFMAIPPRLFVNISSHVHWYRERGVRVYPILVIRDAMLHFQGIVNKGGHCQNAQAAYQQFEQGREILYETMLNDVHPTIVSYEAMMTLQKPYLQHLYHRLHIQSSYMPDFRNGNTKYVSEKDSVPEVEQKLMAEDKPILGIPQNLIARPNLSRRPVKPLTPPQTVQR